ncbi:N-acetylglutaminylglutamine amidotransferase [Cellulomonas sp. URHE0023]|uniref:N-acetylglutaminylglutamine amidotransferase n=1 Tax=Cellulomonas sp. URHE0023 TaxID=1380354 RepID=UPI0004850BE2|nr:N-acetylglutaminylglutamine amidotransferase [Cellulomonas sp. URHE0023]
MCGICGEITFDGSPADGQAVERMSKALAARGPDGSGSWSEGRVALGHRRLAIIDVSDAGLQPMVDDDLDLVCVFNGIIYNYRELREQLRREGYRFSSASDTEVVVKAYHRWGTSFVDHLVGMFAVVLLERRSGRVVMARDRLGIKPLYVSRAPGRLRFASTLPALLEAGDVDTALDPVALHHYLSWRAVGPAPRTILEGVRKLPPATVRVVHPDGREQDHVYWAPDYVRREQERDWDERDWTDAVHDALRTAVRRRMVADVPVGVLLSGGLDSSLVVALLAEAGQTGLASFSIGFPSGAGAAGDEFRWSDAVAQRFGTDHHRVTATAQDVVEAFPHTVQAMSEPMVSHDTVAFDLLAQEVSTHVRVVQSGQGADEVFGGYHWHAPLADVPRSEAAETYAGLYFERDHADMARLLAPEWHVAEDPSRALVAAHLARPGAQSTVDAVLRLDTEVMLVDDPVMRLDSMTMASGLEARVPFLDHELVELAAACPPELALAHGGKGVLKSVARRLLPADVVDRPKGYFPVPAVTHLDGPVLELVRDTLTSPTARQRGLFRREYVDALLAEPEPVAGPTGVARLWPLAVLELWLQTHGIR